MLPALRRAPDALNIIEHERHWIMRSPRQSGKTTFINALVEKVNSDGEKYALSCSLAALRGVSGEGQALAKVISQPNAAMKHSEAEAIRQKACAYDTLPGMGAPDTKVRAPLTQLCLDLDKPLAVFFDGAASLSGAALVTFLSQI
jgi:hypothetical protein